MQTHIDEQVYLPALIPGAVVGDDGCVLRGHHFTGCTIYGPAVVRFLDGVNLDQPSTFAGRVEELLIADDREQLLGVIGLADCTFDFCRFAGIAFSCPSDEVEPARQALCSWIIDEEDNDS